jgi:hypothetical protein
MLSRLCRIAAMGLVAAALFAGCSRGGKIVPVSGRVTLAGKPVGGAVISFQPLGEDGEKVAIIGSTGKTDADGRFTLRRIEPDAPGAAPGKHVVTITTARVADRDAALPKGEIVPRKWRDGSQTYVVPAEGTDNANFELSKR